MGKSWLTKSKLMAFESLLKMAIEAKSNCTPTPKKLMLVKKQEQKNNLTKKPQAIINTQE